MNLMMQLHMPSLINAPKMLNMQMTLFVVDTTKNLQRDDPAPSYMELGTATRDHIDAVLREKATRPSPRTTLKFPGPPFAALSSQAHNLMARLDSKTIAKERNNAVISAAVDRRFYEDDGCCDFFF